MSSVDDTIPVTNSEVASAELRNNFGVIKSELEVLESDVATLQLGGTGSGLAPPIAQGRLTTESGVALSTSDRTAQSTLYYTPFIGQAIVLYDGAVWTLYSFSEASLALSGLTSGKNYDVFVYWNSGALALALGSAWTNDTTRADALGSQNGIPVLGSDATKLWVGTIRTTSTTTTEDSAAKRLVWNAYNRASRPVWIYESTSSWNYTTATWRQVRGSSSNQIDVVDGLGISPCSLWLRSISTNGTANVIRVSGIGVDSTTTYFRNCVAAVRDGIANLAEDLCVSYFGSPGLGYHYLVWMEWSQATGTTTWSGGGTYVGLTGIWEC